MVSGSARSERVPPGPAQSPVGPAQSPVRTARTRTRMLPLGILTLALVTAAVLRPTPLMVGLAVLLAAIGAGRSLVRSEPWGRADDITTARLGLLLVFTALIVGGTGFGWAAVAVAALGLTLDAVDGKVARNARSSDPGCTDAGAAYDESVDALVVLVLSLGLVPLWGWWCALPGLLFYGFRGVTLLRPAWRRALPPSRARKVVAASQGVLLLTAGSPPALAAPPLGVLCAGAALLALGWSFGRDIVWLERHRAEGPGTLSVPGARPP